MFEIIDNMTKDNVSFDENPRHEFKVNDQRVKCLVKYGNRMVYKGGLNRPSSIKNSFKIFIKTIVLKCKRAVVLEKMHYGLIARFIQ